jgi:hypothetical protein
MITKIYNKDFKSEGGALTLNPSEVTDGNEQNSFRTKKHEDGWTISGEIHEDYYVWVNDFEAVHEKFGRVWGNFETEVYADSEEGYNDFYSKHTPNAWDYYDI